MTAQQAIAHCAKFKSLSNAKNYAARAQFHLRIVMGCDGRYWVAATPREQSVLMQSGYETI